MPDKIFSIHFLSSYVTCKMTIASPATVVRMVSVAKNPLAFSNQRREYFRGRRFLSPRGGCHSTAPAEDDTQRRQIRDHTFAEYENQAPSQNGFLSSPRTTLRRSSNDWP